MSPGGGGGGKFPGVSVQGVCPGGTCPGGTRLCHGLVHVLNS